MSGLKDLGARKAIPVRGANKGLRVPREIRGTPEHKVLPELLGPKATRATPVNKARKVSLAPKDRRARSERRVPWA